MTWQASVSERWMVVALAATIGVAPWPVHIAEAAPPNSPPASQSELKVNKLEIELEGEDSKVHVKLEDDGSVSTTGSAVDATVSGDVNDLPSEPSAVGDGEEGPSGAEGEGPPSERRSQRRSFALTDKVETGRNSPPAPPAPTSVGASNTDIDIKVNIHVGRACPTCMPRYPKRHPRHYLLAPYDIPASAGGMGLEPVEISDPGDPTVTRGRASVPISFGPDAGVGFGFTFGFRPVRALAGAGKRVARPGPVVALDATEPAPMAEPAPSSEGNGAYRSSPHLGTYGSLAFVDSFSSGYAPEDSAVAETEPGALPEQDSDADLRIGKSPGEHSVGFRYADSIEFSFAVSPLAPVRPVDLGLVQVPGFVAPANRYSIGVSIDILEGGSKDTIIDETRDRAVPKDWDKNKLQKSVAPGSGRNAMDACIDQFNETPAADWDAILLNPISDSGSTEERALTFIRNKLRGVDFEDVEQVIDDTLDELDVAELGEDAATKAREKLAELSRLAARARQPEHSEAQRRLDMQECGARDSRVLFGLNSVVHLQNIDTQFSAPLWRSNLVLKVNFGRRQKDNGDPRWSKRWPAYANRLTPGWLGSVSAQAGIDTHFALDEMATDQRRRRVSGGGDVRAALGARFFRWRLEGGLRGGRADGEGFWNYWGIGTGFDLLLPYDVTVSPGVRFSAYEAVESFDDVDTRVFLNVGWGRQKLLDWQQKM